MEKRKPPQKKTEFYKILRRGGLKATSPRLAVLEFIAKEKKPVSAAHVIDALGKRIDQATIYRTFKTLKEMGLLKPVDLRHNHAHYEIAAAGDHHHLVCTRCGRIEDIEHRGAEEMSAAVLKHSKHFASVSQHAMEFYGVCKSCARK